MNAEAECVGRRGRESSRAAAPKHGRTPPVSRAASLLDGYRLVPCGRLRQKLGAEWGPQRVAWFFWSQHDWTARSTPRVAHDRGGLSVRIQRRRPGASEGHTDSYDVITAWQRGASGEREETVGRTMPDWPTERRGRIGSGVGIEGAARQDLERTSVVSDCRGPSFNR